MRPGLLRVLFGACFLFARPVVAQPASVFNSLPIEDRPLIWTTVLAQEKFRISEATALSPTDYQKDFPEYFGQNVRIVIRNPLVNNKPIVTMSTSGPIVYAAGAKIEQALQGLVGGGTLILPPAIYIFDDLNHKRAHLLLTKMNDLVIDGSNSSFVFQDVTKTGVFIQDSQRIVLKNLTLDWQFNPALPGIVEESNGVRSVRVLTTDPFNITDYHAIYTFNTADRRWYEMQGQERLLLRSGESFQSIGGNRFTHPRIRDLSIGRTVIFMNERDGKGSTLQIQGRDTEDVQIENVQFFNTPQMSLVASGARGVRVANCRSSIPNNRLISGRADGLHFYGLRGDIVLDNNRFGGQGDDAVNIHGLDLFVSEIRPDGSVAFRTSTGSRNRPLLLQNVRVGDQFAFFDKSRKPLGFGVVQSLTPIADGIVLQFGDSLANPYSLVKSRLAVGDNIFDLNVSSSRYYIANNFFYNSAGRGMLLQSPLGLVEGNTMSGTVQAGMYLMNSNGAFYNGPGPTDVEIRKNHIRFTNLFAGESNIPAGALTLYTEADYGTPLSRFPAIQAVTINDNVIENVGGLGIQISHAREVRVKNNVISQANLKPFLPPEPTDTVIPSGSLMFRELCRADVQGNTRLDTKPTQGMTLENATLCPVNNFQTSF